MSPFRLILASLVYHWRIHLAVALGVAAGTAVLTGALLVGDSMRGSLSDLTLQRLGRIDAVLRADRFFRAELAEELAAAPGFSTHFTAAVPAILLRATVENPDPDRSARAGVNLLGCDRTFWELYPGSEPGMPEGRQIVLNRPLAEQLGVGVGDSVLLRLPRPSAIPADSALGRKTETVRTHRLTVGRIVPATGPGRFDLRASQQVPRNALVPLEWLATQLERPEEVNMILVAGKNAKTAPPPEAEAWLSQGLRPSLADYGLRVEKTERGYINITSERMLLEPPLERAVLEALDGQAVQPALTYLANTIACGERQTPYSTITAVDFAAEPPLGPFVTPDGKPIGPLADGEIVLNRWAADDLQATPGDRIRVTYFEPETREGELREQTAEFRLAAVVELAGAAADPDFTPEVAGVTDQTAIADWDPPFPFDARRIRPKDEDYWDTHRATPKAFVSLAAGRRLWASRFGQTTSLRVAPSQDAEPLLDRLGRSLDPAQLGFVFQPVKRQGLEASSGTTPFSALFLGLSFFIILAAVMLVALLFRLGVESRAPQVGILLAVGLGRRRVGRLLALEGLLVAALGSLAGVGAGIGYAVLMLAGLHTWWLAAIVTPFLQLHMTPQSLLLGYFSGVAVAMAAVVWSVRDLGRMAPRRLLAGAIGPPFPRKGKRETAGRWAGLLLGAALALSLAALAVGEEVRAGIFFGAGALTLAAGLAAIWGRLRSGSTGPAVAAARGDLIRLALRNVARSPGRSTLTVGAVAAASFLIVSVSAFRIDPSTERPERASGNGGFTLMAQSDQPVYQDLNSPDGRMELGFSPKESRELQDARVFAFRVKPGDDASCLNLYQPQQPRILGVPKKFIERGGFVFAGQKTPGPSERRNPWRLLHEEPREDRDGVPVVPVILDDATAKYSLHRWKGVGEILEVADRHGRTIRLEIVGLLKTSIFQGDVLMNEAAFRRFFPEVNGYRYFLVETPPEQSDAVRDLLQRVLGDYGFLAETTAGRLARLLAVQNTYLSTFQTLGGLGLLLGTFGLAAVQLRNVLERRRELALLRAVGFRRQMLAWLVMLENGLLLVAGLGCGGVAAAVAVLPHFLLGGATAAWPWFVGTLLLVLVVGLLAGQMAVRAALAAPVLTTLREE